MRYALAVAALMIVAGEASAQQFPAKGTRIQAKTDFGLVAGIVQRRATDSIWVADPNSGVRVLRRFEVREISTYGTQWGRGARRGAIVGGILGAITLGTAIWMDTHWEGECICVPITYIAAPVSLGLPLIGAGVGVMFAPDGWSKPKTYF